VANRLNSFRKGAVGFTDWLGLCAWLIDQSVIVRILAVERLAAAPRTTFHLAAEDVQLTFRNAAVMARLATSSSPVFFLLAIANALKDFAADPEGLRNSIFCQCEIRPNEKEISYGRVS
jgi:hypothetical protein